MVILTCKICGNLNLTSPKSSAYPAHCSVCDKDLDLYQCHIAYADKIKENHEKVYKYDNPRVQGNSEPMQQKESGA